MLALHALQEHGLKGHIGVVHEGKKHNCSKRGAKFAQKPNLNRHIAAVHEGKKPYK